MSNIEYTGLEIAVIGMACRFPGAVSIDDYWENLKNGIESVTFFTDEELIEAGIPEQMLKHPDYVPAMAVLDDIESFDAGFFDYAPLEAGIMDPQMRLFHECAWSALEDAGIVPGEYGGLIGLYAGGYDTFSWKSMVMLSGKNQGTGVYELEQLVNKDFICSKVAYKLDLKGPVASVQTACSTSLVAIHMGCQALLSGEADAVLAGGVSIIPFKTGYVYVEGMINSPDGRCRAFDEQAKGFYAGNGGGVVVLKRYEDAVNDGDHIYAMIKGSAVNNDGRQKIGFTAPSVEAQAEVIADAIRTAQVPVETIGFIETHGTGTVLGDPVEMEALSIAYRSEQRGFCGIGSVKTNFGHLDAAAGVAGFIKAVLSLKNRLIPPTLHFQSPNPRINFIDSPFYLNAELSPWESNTFPRRAGVSSLGLGGTNAHVILEETPVVNEIETDVMECGSLIVISGRNPEVVERNSANLARYLERHPDLAVQDVAYTLQAGRKAFRFRRAFVARSLAEAVETISGGNAGPVFENPVDPGTGTKKSCFFLCLDTPGPETVPVWRELLENLPVLQETVETCFDTLQPIAGFHIKRRLLEKGARMTSELLAVASVIFQYALFSILEQSGIKPALIAGRGTGEIAAACLAGIISRDDMLQMAFSAGQLSKQANRGRDGGLTIPAGMADIFKGKLRQLKFQPPRVPYFSGMTGRIEDGGTVGTATYWTQLEELLEAPGFRDGMERLLDEDSGENEPRLLTAGMGALELTGSVPEYIIPLVVPVIPGLTGDENLGAYPVFLRGIGKLWCSGFPVKWQELNRGRRCRKVSLPPYAFEKHRFPVEGNPFQVMNRMVSGTPVSAHIQKEPDIGRWFYLPAWKRTQKLAQINSLTASLSTNTSPNTLRDHGPWMIFMDHTGPGEDFSQCLEEGFGEGLGVSLEKILLSLGQKVIRITAGSQYRKDDAGNYCIDPQSPRDYMSLVGDLMAAKTFPRKIFHLWSLSRERHEDIGMEHFYSYQYRGFYSLLLLANAIHSRGVEHDVQVNVVTSKIRDVTGTEEICPEFSTLMGAVKSIPQEYPYIVCRCIDVQLPEPERRWDKRVTHQLIAEFYESRFEPVIAYRGNYRWVEDYDQILLPEAMEKIPMFKPGGVYLITGGLGNIGHLLAVLLARQVDAKLILISRSGVPDKSEWDAHLKNNPANDPVCKKIRKLKELDEMGASYTLKLADAGNLDQMEFAVAEAEAQFGPVNGVFHAAGEADNSVVCTIGRLSEDMIKRQFQGRVLGLLVLERILQDRQPDFCVIVSFLASVLGGIGFAGFAAASNFLDTFAHYGNRLGRFPWISIGTPEWVFEDIPENSTQSGIAAEMIELAMTVDEGLETFKRILSHCAEGRVVVSTGDIYARVEKWVKLKTLHTGQTVEPDDNVTLYPRPDLSTPYAPPETPEQKKMVNIWQNFFAIEPVGIDDNFFQLGGDSLKVITLVSKIHKEFQVRLTIETFFVNPDIRRLMSSISTADAEVKEKYTSIEPIEEREYYPLSSGQKRIYFLQQMDDRSTTYNSKFVQLLGKNIDSDRFEKALIRLINRHESLRTSFHMIGEEPVQRIRREVTFRLEFFDVADMAAKSGLEWQTLAKTQINDFFEPFDLAVAPLFRSALVKLPDHNHIWLWDVHHIVSDGISHTIMMENFYSLYSGRRLEPLDVQFKDFSFWQNRLLVSGEIEKQYAYWRELFSDIVSGDVPRLALPADYPRPPVFTFRGANCDFTFDRDITGQFRAMGQANGGTLYMNILAALCTLFYKYTGQTDIVIGSGVAGRPHLDLQDIVGMFVNTLATRNTPTPEKSYETFLKEVIASSIKALENQDIQFEELVDQLNLYRDPSRNPLFDICMVVQNYRQAGEESVGASHQRKKQKTEVPESPGGTLDFVDRGGIGNAAKFDITFYIFEDGDDVRMSVEYYSSIFSHDTVQRLLAHFKNVVREVTREPSVLLRDIRIMSDIEREQVLYAFNDNSRDFPGTRTIHRMFLERAERNPHAVAVVHDDIAITYGELRHRASQLAQYLRVEKRIGENEPVAAWMTKSPELPITVMGILEAGGAYLPVDPEMPRERIAYMLNDAKVGVVISRGGYIPDLDAVRSRCPHVHSCMCLDSTSRMEKAFKPNPRGERSSERERDGQLAYIIYTSGSTGKPKGVMIDHSSLVNFIYTFNHDFSGGFSLTDNCLSVTSLVFDVSISELFLPLSFGATLVLLGKDRVMDVEYLTRTIIERCITYTYMHPSLLTQLARNLSDAGVRLSLNKMLVGVEPIEESVLQAFLDLDIPIQVVNGYGPTETTICATGFAFKGITHPGRNVPIGRGLSNTIILLLDRDLQPVPVGVQGEIYIGGAGVGRGYLNNPELTGESFITVDRSIFPGTAGAGESLPLTLYKTGDMGRWLRDGNIMFSGRVDHQVKIRGYRIETGEIEKRLSTYPGIGDVVVTARQSQDGGKYLCVYYTCGGTVPETEQLKRHLAEVLPEYMIPGFFVLLDRVPLTPNGKVDRRVLPEPQAAAAGTYVPPRNNVERTLVDTWSEILHTGSPGNGSKIGIDDNFFDIGGHSLKAMVLSTKIHKKLNVKIPLSEIFRTQTIRSLAAYIEDMNEDRYISIAPGEIREYYPLTPAQKRVYFIQQMDVSSVAYNIPMMVPIGKHAKGGNLEHAFRQLIFRHESLRTSFTLVGETPVQCVHAMEDIEFAVEEYTSPASADFVVHRDFVRPFDLSRAPLLRAGLLRLPGEFFALLVDMHHIVADGTSHTILTEDFLAMIRGDTLEPLPIRYTDYALWYDRLARTGALDQQVRFWKTIYPDGAELPRLQLPEDFKRPRVFDFKGGNYRFTFGSDVASRFRELGSRSGATLFVNFLAALNVLFYKYTGQGDIIIGTGSAGRSHADLQGIIGMFIETLAMRNCPAPGKTYAEFLKEVADKSIAAFDNQGVQLDELVETLDIQRDTSRNPLFDVMMIVQNYRMVGEGNPAGTGGESSQTKPKAEDAPGIDGVEFKNTVSKFDLTFYVFEEENDIHIDIEYYTSVFKRDTVARLARHLERLADNLGRDPHRRLKDIDILSPEEREQVVQTFNRTSAPYPGDKSLAQLFREQVTKSPDAVAAAGLQDGPITAVTYSRLYEQAATLAAALINIGVRPGAIVGVRLERSLDMLSGVLAILFTGAAYLPIDPGYPADRVRYILADSNAALLIAEPGLETNIENKCLTVSSIPDLVGKVHAAKGEHDTFGTKTSESGGQLAYIIYTSGSTGRPKGVMVEHRSVVRLVKNTRYIDFRPGQKLLQTGALEFDASTFEIWGSVLNGLELVLAPKADIIDPERLKPIVHTYAIDIMWLTSPLFNRLADSDPGIFSPLRVLLVGGDILSPSHIRRVRRLYPGLTVINGYGPTENTTFSTTFAIDADYENIPIGIPVTNSRAFILDTDSRPLPVGIPGELWLGGDGIARGYLNNPELTAEKFVAPGSTCGLFSRDSVLYRTGDLARWLSDGNIEFLGRIDNQVKIRGFRIEPGEIEHRLIETGLIQEAAVVPAENNSELWAYVVPAAESVETGGELLLSRVKELLSSRLPSFMVPSRWMTLEHIPLTVNGKVDTRSLPLPGLVAADDSFAAPANDVEEQLAAVFAEVLGIETDRIGIGHDFFELGGHSIKATVLTAQIYNRFGVRVPVADIFEYSTVRELARRIHVPETDRATADEIAIEPLPPGDWFELSFNQKRLYILQQMNPADNSYNIPWSVHLGPDTDRRLIAGTLEILTRKHESLRTGFKEVNGKVVQYIIETCDIPLEVEDISLAPASEKDGRFRRLMEQLNLQPYDLSAPPLFRALLLKVSPREYILGFNIHHIVSDGWSIGILERDFDSIYRSLVQGTAAEPGMEPGTVTYKDYANWQNRRLEHSAEIADSKEFWSSFLSEPLPPLALPGDFEGDTSGKIKSGAGYRFVIPGDIRDLLTVLGKSERITLFSLMYSVYLYFLSSLSGQRTVVVSIVNSGRDHPQLENVVGFFVNSVIFKTDIDDQLPFIEFARHIQSAVLKFFRHQNYPMELVLDEAGMAYPNVTASFNMVNLDLQGNTGFESPDAFHTPEIQNVKFDIEPYIREYRDGIEIDVTYNRALFRPATIEFMMGKYRDLLVHFSRNPNNPLKLKDTPKEGKKRRSFKRKK